MSKRSEILKQARSYFEAHPGERACQVVTVNPRWMTEVLGEPETVSVKVTRSEAYRSSNRRERDQAMRDLGLVRVRGALGGTYWE